jgi:hypothetical protein
MMIIRSILPILKSRLHNNESYLKIILHLNGVILNYENICILILLPPNNNVSSSWVSFLEHNSRKLFSFEHNKEDSYIKRIIIFIN